MNAGVIQSVIQSLFRDMQIILKKISNTHCFTKVFDSRLNLISLRSDIDFGNHPKRIHFTDLFKSENKKFFLNLSKITINIMNNFFIYY